MASLKDVIRGTPVLGDLIVGAARAVRRVIGKRRSFPGSELYWEDRYAKGGNSGGGSYGKLATYKAQVLNAFVSAHAIRSVIEHGCGDGNQLSLAEYPQYLGLDVSRTAIESCRARFRNDPTKAFLISKDYGGEVADLGLSLDVVYHLVEDAVFEAYMERLFDSSRRYAIIYASDTDDTPVDTHDHVRHRKFTRWVAEHRPGWRLAEKIPNRHPYAGNDQTGSFADFHVFARTDEA